MLRCYWIMMIVLLTGFTAVGCAQSPPAGEAVSAQPDLVACEDPRPQMCTAIYDPVCALTADGSYKTYASACTACGDVNVSGHRPGACE
jgi:hypothetical protein